MSENKNKDIGFDILENSDMDTIERIGTDNMDIDKNARDRILRYTMNKYEKEKREMIVMKDNNKNNIDTAEDTVSGVERYERRRLPHMLYIGMCSAAAVALVAGSIFMIKNHSFRSPDKDDKLAEPTTSVSDTTVLPTTVTDVQTVTAAETVTTAHESEIKPDNNVSAEAYEAARIRALEKFMNEGSYIEYNDNDGVKTEFLNSPKWNIEYAFEDINGDSVPELFISHMNNATSFAQMYIYDGNEYAQAHTMAYTWNGEYRDHYITAATFRYCPEENLLYTWSKEGYENTAIYKFESDNILTTIYQSNYSGMYQSGEKVQQYTDYNSDKKYENYKEIVDSYNWKDLEYIEYAKTNKAADELAEEQNNTQENEIQKMDKAFTKVMESFINEGALYCDENGELKRSTYEKENVRFCRIDINGDGLPELFIYAKYPNNLMENQIALYRFDGTEYVPVIDEDPAYTRSGKPIKGCIVGENISICPEEKLIYTTIENNGHNANIIRIDIDGTTKVLYSYNYRGLYKDGELIAENTEDNPNEAYNQFQNIFIKHNWEELTFEEYTGNN